jgi:hypothetical protein
VKNGNQEQVDRVIHDLRNSLGSIILNLEIVADPAHASGVALEAAVDALDEARRLKSALANLRAAMDVKS